MYTLMTYTIYRANVYSDVAVRVVFNTTSSQSKSLKIVKLFVKELIN